MNKDNLFDNIAIGWHDIEPIIITNLALKKPIILEGTHGICKSTLGREISRLFGENACRCYDATKDDLVSIASVPIPDELAKGRLVFSKHDRSIWDAKVVYIDELMRANRENQNLWLEILEEKTLFGQKLVYEMVIATQNPEGYASNFDLDEALLDRFNVVVPIPNLQTSKSELIKKVIKINVNRKNGSGGNLESKLDIVALQKIVDDVRVEYAKMLGDKELSEVVYTFVSEFMELVLKIESKSTTGTDKLYISPRRWTHLAEEILGMYAYRLVTNRLENKQDKVKALEQSAYWSIFYTIATVLKVDMELLDNVFKKTKVILSEFALTEADRLRIDMMKMSADGDLIDYMNKNFDQIKELLPEYEIKMVLGKMISKDKKETQLKVYEICKRFGISVYESMGVLIETVILNIDSYGFQNKYRSSDEMSRKLKEFPPDEETYGKIIHSND